MDKIAWYFVKKVERSKRERCLTIVFLYSPNWAEEFYTAIKEPLDVVSMDTRFFHKEKKGTLLRGCSLSVESSLHTEDCLHKSFKIVVKQLMRGLKANGFDVRKAKY